MYTIISRGLKPIPRPILIGIAIAALISWFCLMLSHPVLLTHSQAKLQQRKDFSWKPDASTKKAVVLASYKGQNVTWTKDVPSDWKIFRYVKNDHSAPLRPPTRSGNEANAYLTFIIDHYDNLPDYTIFLHGHDRGWHQPEHSVQKIRALNLSALSEEGYINMRCSQTPGCGPLTVLHIKNPQANPEDHRWMLDVLPGFIAEMFPDMDHLPDVVGSQCCAQFAASKDKIRSRSKAWWIKYRQPLLETNLLQYSMDKWQAPSPGIGDYKSGILYEKTYHMAFGKEPVHCPNENYCRKVYFSNAIRCSEYTGTFHQSKDSWEDITCIET